MSQVRTHPHQSHHVLINKSWLCRYTREQTHAITLNTTSTVGPWKIFIIIFYKYYCYLVAYYHIILLYIITFERRYIPSSFVYMQGFE